MGDVERFEILRPLGADQATMVARDTTSTAPRFFVIERVTRTSPVPAARTELLRRGRALVALEHPKVVRVREVFERDGDVLVASDYVDGEWLAALMMMKPRPPLQLMVRLLLDVLEGLSALHDLRDDKGQLIGFVHGALAPDTVLVAEDGVAEIARACRLPRPGANERYVAPELRRSDEPIDVRCDVYAAGAILRDILVDAPAEAVWAEPLTDIAWRGDAPPPSSGEPLSIKPSEMEVVEPGLHASLVETLPPPPLKKEPVGRLSLTKKAAVLSMDDAREPSEPDTLRRGSTTEPGLSKPGPPARPLPPPELLAPQEALPLPPPPPTIHLSDDPPTESYRRQMPTFPTWEREPPPRRRTALQGVVVAAGMLVTFAAGWWVGRTYAPAVEVAQKVCPSATVASAATTPASAAPSASVASVAATGSTAVASAPSVAPSASAAVAVVPTATAAPTFALPPAATRTPVATAAPTATAPRVTPTATATTTAAAPKPAPSGGYVPTEL